MSSLNNAADVGINGDHILFLSPNRDTSIQRRGRSVRSIVPLDDRVARMLVDGASDIEVAMIRIVAIPTFYKAAYKLKMDFDTM